MAKIITLPKTKQSIKSVETSVIYCGDNLEVMRQLPSESIDIIYIDPPFFSGKKYETIWGGKVEVAYRDYRKGGIEFFIGWLTERLDQMHRLLKPTGSLFVHMDHNAIHYAKITLDKIFGNGNPNKGRNFLINEIIWSYQDPAGGRNGNFFQRKHETILWYCKSPKKIKFEIPRQPLSDSTIKRFEKYFDEKGVLTYKKLKETNPGVFKNLKCVPANLNDAWLDKNKGAPMTDWWDDIAPIKRKGEGQKGEAVGWDTQKPLALLERIIKLYPDKNTIVADFFCGCGTTLVAAHKLGRKYIGVDISPIASKVIRQRLSELGETCKELAVKSLSKAQVLKLHHTEFEEYVVRCLGGHPNEKKVSDGGIDGRLIVDGTPIQVKQSEHVGRIVLDAFHKHLKHNNRGIIVAISFGRGVYEEQARLKQEGFDLQLVTIDELLEKAA